MCTLRLGALHLQFLFREFRAFKVYIRYEKEASVTYVRTVPSEFQKSKHSLCRVKRREGKYQIKNEKIRSTCLKSISRVYFSDKKELTFKIKKDKLTAKDERTR